MRQNTNRAAASVARVLVAARSMVEAAADGYDKLGRLLGKTCGSLRNEVAPRGPDSRAKLGLADAVRLMHHTGDLRLLHTLALEFGHLALPLPAAALPSPCADTVAGLAKEFGDLIAVYSQALIDNRVTNNELAHVVLAWGELVVAGQVLINDAAARNAALNRTQGMALRS